MKNTLPGFRTFTVDKNAYTKKFSEWKPDSTLPANCEIPLDIQKEFSADVKPEQFRPPDNFQSDPNSKYARPIYSKDESPLCAANCGVSDAPHIAAPKVDKPYSYPIRREKVDNVQSRSTIFTVANFSGNEFDIFIRKESTFKNITINPFDEKQCYFSAPMLPPEYFTFFFSPFKYIGVIMTGRQIIREYSFQPGPIGLEVEDRESRLVCTNVIENSQASEHECYIVGGEVVAVNGQRVISLSHFQELVMLANQTAASVVLTIVAYITPRKKTDDLFAYNLNNKKGTVKSLLSNILKTGIDKDHQHDIELPGKRDDDDDDEDSDDDSDEGKEQEEKAQTESKSEQNKCGSRRQSEKPAESKNDEDLSGTMERVESKVVIYSGNISTVQEVNSVSMEHRQNATTHESHVYHDEENEDQDNLLMAPRKHGAESDVAESKLDYSNELLEEKHISEDKNEVIEAIVPNNEANNSEEKSLDDGDDGDDNASMDSWEYATAITNIELTPFFQLSCLSPFLSKSLDWGKPNEVLSIVNFSRTLHVYVYWVDGDGALILRKLLPPGEKHLDMVSEDHVWVLVTSVIDSKEDLSSHKEIPDLTNSNSMVLRPSKSTLAANLTFVAVWVPNQSLSMSQRAIAAKQGDVLGMDEPLPKLSLQIFDPKKS